MPKRTSQAEPAAERPILLQYIIMRFLGEPDSDRGDGEAYWPCPACGKDGKFHTLPHKDGVKDRFKCWSCNFWGDWKDIIAHFCRGETHDQHLERLRHFQADYERAFAAPPPADPSISSRGESWSHARKREIVRRVYDKLSAAERDVLLSVSLQLFCAGLSAHVPLTLDDIARYCSDYDFPEEFDAAHHLNVSYSKPVDFTPTYRAHPLFRLMEMAANAESNGQGSNV